MYKKKENDCGVRAPQAVGGGLLVSARPLRFRQAGRVKRWRRWTGAFGEPNRFLFRTCRDGERACGFAWVKRPPKTPIIGKLYARKAAGPATTTATAKRPLTACGCYARLAFCPEGTPEYQACPKRADALRILRDILQCFGASCFARKYNRLSLGHASWICGATSTYFSVKAGSSLHKKNQGHLTLLTHN